MTPSLILKPEREKSLNRKHPWIFEGAVEKAGEMADKAGEAAEKAGAMADKAKEAVK